MAKGFALSTPHDWLEKKKKKNFRHCFIQSEVQPKPIVTCSHAISRILRQLPIFTWSFDWFAGLSLSLLIGWRNYFGIGFATLN